MYWKGKHDMNYKIAICDDAAADRDYLSDLVQRWAVHKGHTVQLQPFSSAEQFLFQYAEEKDFDILLLDIELGAMDGLSLARRLRQESDTVQILFITGYPDYVLEGYDVAALHYLLKPVDQEKLSLVLDRAANNLCKSRRTILLDIGGELRKFPVDTIEYVEAFSHSVAVVTTSGTYTVKKSISEMASLLGKEFVRCHRSYLAGLKYISRISKTELILDGGAVLPLSRSAFSTVHRAFVSYYTGEDHETI